MNYIRLKFLLIAIKLYYKQENKKLKIERMTRGEWGKIKAFFDTSLPFFVLYIFVICGSRYTDAKKTPRYPIIFQSNIINYNSNLQMYFNYKLNP